MDAYIRRQRDDRGAYGLGIALAPLPPEREHALLEFIGSGEDHAPKP